MAHRQFTDESGALWEAWDVYPSVVENRWSEEHGPRDAPDATKPARVMLPEQFRDGWLAFRSDAENRRLAPIPNHWNELSNDDLSRLVSQALPVVRSHARSGA